MMANSFHTRYDLKVGAHHLALEPLDEENYALIMDGDYEASFTGARSAHQTAIARAKHLTSFSESERALVGDLNNWQKEMIDLFDPEED
jgi:hypothetical protein